MAVPALIWKRPQKAILDPGFAAVFGKAVITEIDEADFYAAPPQLREQCGDRAVMCGIHEYHENRRVPQQVVCLERGDFGGFLKLTKESGFSSWMYLQNVIPAGYVRQQAMAVALGLCQHYLQGQGAYRVHGGGFAGTVQAFVPLELLESFRVGIDATLGKGACHVLSIRPQGGVEMQVKDEPKHPRPIPVEGFRHAFCASIFSFSSVR